MYSLRGKSAVDAIKVTAGNFARTVPFTLVLSATAFAFSIIPIITVSGVVYAVVSGVLTSAIGYAIWYTALPALKATTAATVQLSVPVIASVGGVVLLGEAVNLRVVLASIAILGGIALVIVTKQIKPKKLPVDALK